MRYLTLVNRTKRILNVTWDGRQNDIHPGKNEFPEAVAQAAKRQNPIMGSEDPYTLDLDYLVGIVEEGDDCTPLDEDKLPKSVERFNRKRMKSKPTEVVEGVTGIYSLRDVAAALPTDGGFVNPDK